jgi:O-antigen ligase
LTKSRTTTAAILVSLASVQVIRSPLASKCAGIFAGGWLAALALWLIWICGIDPISDFRDAVLLGRAEESDTLSGRAFIWPEVVSFASERFWLGYGYESFWTPGRIETISDKLGWGLREAHNAYLEVWLSLGAIGVTLYLLVASVALAAGVRGWRQTGQSVYALPIGLVVFGLINAGLESGMVAVSELVPFVLGCCLLRMALFRDCGGRNDEQS